MNPADENCPFTAAPADAGRRGFVTGTAAAMLAAVSPPAPAADGLVANSVAETSDVRIPMAGGFAEAAFFHPAKGAWPGVLLWTDAYGLRPATREMGRRLAAQGYAVLVPNPFYRVADLSALGTLTNLSFQNEQERARLMQLMGSVKPAGTAEQDAQAYLAFLSSQPAVRSSARMGVQGYCMGGALALRTGASAPERIGAIATFHGGGLVTDKPESPHLLAPHLKAQLYIAIAGNDDADDPQAKGALRKAFADAGLASEVEVYAGAQHGWCMPDLGPRYAHADAERAWSRLLALYQRALV